MRHTERDDRDAPMNAVRGSTVVGHDGNALNDCATLLVTAAAHHDVDTAVAAWRTWRTWAESGSPDSHGDRGSGGDVGIELLPTVGFRLAKVLAADELTLATDARRHAARSNLKLVAGFAAPLAALATHGVHPIVLKGGAMLSTTAFDDLSARWLSDIDILIAPDEAATAVRVLTELGLHRWPARVPDRIIHAVMHAASYAGNGLNLDVHWTLLHNTRCLPEDRALRSRTTNARLGPLHVRVPDRTDLLLHTLAHGELPDLRWLVDASHLLDPRLAANSGSHSFDDGTTVDIERLARTASRRRYLTRVTENVEVLGAVLPGEDVDRLRTALSTQPRLRGDSTNVDYGVGSMPKRTAAASMVVFNQVRDRSPAEAFRFLIYFPQYVSHSTSIGGVLRKFRSKNRQTTGDTPRR